MRERLNVTPLRFRAAAWTALASLTLIVFTGAAVRLTDSGLGCEDWPRCSRSHLTPPDQLHAFIEFGNRSLSGIVGVVTVVVMVMAFMRRPRRRDLTVLATLLPLGVVAQAVLGGYTVKEKLAPGFVMAHFGLSMLILVAAVALVWRCYYPARSHPRRFSRPLVWTVRATVVLGAITIFAGTVSTAAGPHSGGPLGQIVQRLHFQRRRHPAMGRAPARDRRRPVRPCGDRRLAPQAPELGALEPTEPLTVLGVLIAAQGLVGSVQYEMKLPAEMVWVHVVAGDASPGSSRCGPGRMLGGSRRRRGDGRRTGSAQLRRAGATSRAERPIEAVRISTHGTPQQTRRRDSAEPPADASLSILVVDDESDLREMLTRSFSREGHRVLAVADGRAAIDRASTEHFDIVLLDVALGPGPDGYEVCRTLRARRNVVPIIMLTALDSEADAVLGLEAGADDYVTKPFGLAELRSRIRAVLRRAGTRAMGDEVLVVGPIALDRAQREVTIDGQPVKLTFSEFELLDALMTDPGRLLNRQELLRAIWGDSAYRDPRAIDVHIRHLREKLEPEPEKPRYILTVRGAGYRLRGS